MKKNATKRALLTSVIALLLCVSMLVGTTFAWFTDSVTSANNIIQSGNLDVEMYYQVEGQSDWTKVTSETNVFMENALWEPGHTEVVKLKIVNEGSLALKYSLGVNIASETGSVNAAGEPFLLSDYIKFAVIDDEQDYTRERAVAAAEAAEATLLKTAYNSQVTSLMSKEDNTTAEDVYTDIVTMVVYMPTSVGNVANHAKGAAQPTINLGISLFATQFTYEKDSFDEFYDENAIIVTTAEEAQAALDNATADTTIQLVPGVDYGMLTFRQTASSTVVDITTAGGDAPGNEKYRRIEDLTIIGAEGAVIDGFDFKVGWIDGSGASYIDVENLTVKGVTFSGEATPFNFEGSKGSALGVDGLTIIDCKMEDANSNNRFVFQQISGYKELIDKTTNAYVMTTGIKDLTITECEVIGAYMVIESRAMENLTITNNIFKGIKQRDMLITSDTTNHADKTYTGTITITGNTSIEGEERFVRGSLNNSYAVVVIKDNTIISYMGADADYIKVTDGNNVTIENNTMTRAYKAATVDELKAALNAAQDGETVILAADITLTSELAISNKSVNIDGNGKKITFASTSVHGIALNSYGTGNSVVEIKNATIMNHNATGNYASAIAVSGINSKLTLTNCTFTGNSGDYVVRADGAVLVISDCLFTGNTTQNVVASGVNGKSNTVAITGSVFENNTINGVSVVYLKEGSSVAEGTATISGCKFAGNTINSNTHAAVLYCDTTTITGNEFVNNIVNAAGARVGVIVLDAGVVSDNVFSGNAIGTTASEPYKATIVSKGDVGTELVLSNNTATDYANVKGNTITVA